MGPEEATNMLIGLEHLSNKDRLRDVEKRRLWRDLIMASQY